MSTIEHTELRIYRTRRICDCGTEMQRSIRQMSSILEYEYICPQCQRRELSEESYPRTVYEEAVPFNLLISESMQHQDERISKLQDRMLALEMMANPDEFKAQQRAIESLKPKGGSVECATLSVPILNCPIAKEGYKNHTGIVK